MLRHYFLTACQAIAANKYLSAISLVGLVIGLTATIQLSLIATNALGFNSFVPDHDRTYLGVSQLSGPGMPAQPDELTVGLATPLLAANIPQIEAIGRLSPQEVSLRLENEERRVEIYWGDPEIFSVLRLSALAGDASTTLRRPNGLVMTETEAEAWFGTADAVGKRMLIDGKTFTVGAILDDIPPQQTDLENGIFASALNSASPLSNLSAGDGGFSIDSRTYLRLAEGADKNDVEEAAARYIDTLVPPPIRGSYSMKLVRLDEIALNPDLRPGARDRLITGTLIVVLVLFIAISNFVNLSIAMAARRQREIGVRKVNGASRGQIAMQFLGETVALVFIAATISLVLSEWLIPPVNAFLDTDNTVATLHEPGFLATILGGSLLLGIVAGAYPAFVLSNFKPAAILRPVRQSANSKFSVQSILVTAQFAILITLIIATVVIHQQRMYAVTEALRVDASNVVTIKASCPQGFISEIARVPGVETVSCSGSEILTGEIFAFLEMNGRRIPTQYVSLLPASFDVFGIKPIAGSLQGLPANGETQTARVVINETAVKSFGFSSAKAAIGRSIPFTPLDENNATQVTVVAVVPDFALTSINDPIKPTVYIDAPSSIDGDGLILAKLSGDGLPQTLQAIDSAWQTVGQQGAIDRSFVSTHLEELYRSLERNTQMFAIFSGIAIALSCLGLIGLSVAAANRRMKEIGVRKALGADTPAILKLLLWQFSKPVLLANLIAWPIAWLAMRHWLDGFAYRVPLHWWVFPFAGAIALLIASLTVGAQSYSAARQRPVNILRYE